MKRHLHTYSFLVILYLHFLGFLNKVKIILDVETFKLVRFDQEIILSRKHLAYGRDVIKDFDFYFRCTSSPEKDYSKNAEQYIFGFEDFPVLTPSIPESVQTIQQYIDLLNLTEGNNVIDLGAYSGLSSILFSKHVGDAGQVVAVEADPANARCCDTNFQRFFNMFGFSPLLIEKAIWNEVTELRFSAQSNLGSAVGSLLPRSSQSEILVQTITLSEIVRLAGMQSVDAIKADVEGSEFFAFLDHNFFANYHPRIVFEPAEEASLFTKSKNIIALLEGYGYTCLIERQIGSKLPLIVCY